MPPSLTDAEEEAARLLEGWWRDENRGWPIPVDPMDLARQLGVYVRLSALPTNQSGNIVVNEDGTAIITLNQFDHTNRQRFTCAHEIGHYLRRHVTGQSRYVDYRDTLAGLGVDSEEIFANQFAAALLMPAHLVTRFHNQGKTAEDMAQRFQTSTQAMSLRLRNLRLS